MRLGLYRYFTTKRLASFQTQHVQTSQTCRTSETINLSLMEQRQSTIKHTQTSETACSSAIIVITRNTANIYFVHHHDGADAADVVAKEDTTEAGKGIYQVGFGSHQSSSLAGQPEIVLDKAIHLSCELASHGESLLQSSPVTIVPSINTSIFIMVCTSSALTFVSSSDNRSRLCTRP